MKTFTNKYDFYRLSEDQREALIGSFFKEEGKEDVYFVFQLENEDTNYGVKQGVVRVSGIMYYDEKRNWFRVGVFSPDDLDMDFDFVGLQDLRYLRRKVLGFMLGAKKQDTSYKKVFQDLQERFPMGERTS
jgi:hypothetical protein